MVISCCINTYKRPALLKKCLLSILNQNLSNEIILEIIVVDNDTLGSAKQVVEEIGKETNHLIKYFIQPVKNISLTRNKAVLEAKGELILFIDDDGFAEKKLISSYLYCMSKYNADAIFGQVVPYYDEGVPVWIKQGFFFERLVQKSGEKSRFTRTTNCIVKTDLIKQFKEPFDPAYGLTGGEDINLFAKLKKQGANFIFCAEAIVYDFVPLERANLRWLTRRYYRAGITYTERVINSTLHKFIKKFYEISKGSIYIIISFLLMILFFPIKSKRYYWYLKIISNIGHIAAVFGLKFEEYKN